jgi:hypothetical protein
LPASLSSAISVDRRQRRKERNLEQRKEVRRRQFRRASAGEYQCMSTPSGAPPHPKELSDYLTRTAGERGGAEPDPVESGNDPLRSPYAPKRAHQGVGTPPNFAKSDLDVLQSAYAAKRAKERAPAEEDAAVRAGAEPLASAPASLHAHPAVAEHAPVAERQAINAGKRQAIDEAPLCPDEMPGGSGAAASPLAGKHGSIDQSRTALDQSLGKHLLDPDGAASLQPGQAAADGPPARAGGEHRDKIVGGLDLEGLEASLRWLQRRQAAAMRLPPAPTLPPLRSTPAPPDVKVGAHDRDRLVDAFRSPLLSLEPARLVPPPMRSDRGPNMMLGVSIACILMAAIVYYYLEAGRSPSSPAMSEPQIASVAPRSSTSTIEPERTAGPGRLLSRAPDGDGEILSKAEELSQRTTPPRATSTSQHEPVVMLKPAAAGAEGLPASKPVRALDPEEISLLIKEGEKHIATGDVVTARIAFQRAAEAGDADAAVALGATYDPTVLAKLGVVGMSADVAKARSWYQKAEKLGSSEGRWRLDVLADH